MNKGLLKNSNYNWLPPLLAFVMVTSSFIFFHEPWRDEVRDFALAIQSQTIQELIDNSQQDGHPALWYFILYVISKFTSSIAAVQVVNLVISALAVFVFLRYAPLKWTWKLLIIAGYFFIYEYSILFRSYATGILLLFLACESIQREKIILSSVLIFFALNANLFAFFIGGALWLVCMLAFFKTHLKKVILSSFIVLSGTIRSVLDIVPPKDYGISIGYQISLDGLVSGLSNVWRAFIPIPNFGINFWNSNFMEFVFGSTFSIYPMALGSLFLILACLYQLRNSAFASVFFLLLTGLIVGFTGIVYPGSLRHHGHLYIVFLIALWLKEIFQDREKGIPLLQKLNLPIFLEKFSFLKQVFPFVFYLHILAGLLAYFYDAQYIFSRGREVATYIQEENLTDRFLIGHYDANISTVAAYLNQPIYYPQSGRTSTFIIWNRERLKPLNDIDLVKIFVEKRKEKKSALLISSTAIKDKNLLKEYNITHLKSFEPSMVEDFYLYE